MNGRVRPAPPDPSAASGPIARRADRAAGVLFYVLAGTLVAMAGAVAGFILGLFVIMGMWIAEEPLPVAPQTLGWMTAALGALLAGVAYVVRLCRRV